MENKQKAVIAEDVKKVGKRVKFSEICDNLWERVNSVKSVFKRINSDLDWCLHLEHFETDENIKNIDFIDCNEDTEDEFQYLIDRMKEAFFIETHHLKALKTFWKKIDNISFNLWESNEKIAKKIALADREEI